MGRTGRQDRAIPDFVRAGPPFTTMLEGAYKDTGV